MNLGIIAIGYNRRNSLERLLSSLNSCDYSGASPLLIISVDKSDIIDVEECAKVFQWKYGEKVVKTFPERQGLYQHILKCGSYMEEYDLDAVAVFEDDIVPSVGFYQYMEQAVEYYKDNDDIAGISLYSYRWNTIADRPFTPLDNGYDVYFSYFACSWGQIWLRKQWKAFTNWRVLEGVSGVENADIPQEIKGWTNSWLKYHIAYCTSQRKYFVYPYKSYATCFSDQGEHTSGSSNRYQVPIVANSSVKYNFVEPTAGKVFYDAYFESISLAYRLDEQGFDTCIDFYGTKGNRKKQRYWLSLELKPYKIVKKYSLCMKPHEQNIFYNLGGNDIFLYDTTEKSSPKKETIEMILNKFIYYFNGSIDKRIVLHYMKLGLCNRWQQCKNFINKIIK